MYERSKRLIKTALVFLEKWREKIKEFKSKEKPNSLSKGGKTLPSSLFFVNKRKTNENKTSEFSKILQDHNVGFMEAKPISFSLLSKTLG